MLLCVPNELLIWLLVDKLDGISYYSVFAAALNSDVKIAQLPILPKLDYVNCHTRFFSDQKKPVKITNPLNENFPIIRLNDGQKFSIELSSMQLTVFLNHLKSKSILKKYTMDIEHKILILKQLPYFNRCIYKKALKRLFSRDTFGFFSEKSKSNGAKIKGNNKPVVIILERNKP